jgi:phosphohistidine phosphatase
LSHRTVLIMRHAKSSWAGSGTDHQRPLNERGRHDAVRVARELQRRAWLPDYVLASDAERTQETVAWLNETWGGGRPTSVLAQLYLPGVGDMLKAIAEAPEEARTLLLVSHNPGCEEVVAWLTGQQVPMTTANVARLVAPAARWGAFVSRPGSAMLAGHLRPRELADGEG